MPKLGGIKPKTIETTGVDKKLLFVREFWHKFATVSAKNTIYTMGKSIKY